MLIVSGISTPLGVPEDEALRLAAKRAGIPARELKSSFVLKSSVDARHKNAISKVYSIGLELNDEKAEQAYVCPAKSVVAGKHNVFCPVMGKEEMPRRPVIAGFGPAGMFAGLLLAELGYRPLILERGLPVEERMERVERFYKTGLLDPSCNIQFGEGGAGTFSDGKLTTRIGDPLCSYVLEKFVELGAPGEILTKAKPHVGTDMLVGIVRNIRRRIENLGGQILFSTRVEDVILSKGRIAGVKTAAGEIETGTLILCVGHSARDTFEMLAGRGVVLEPKPFSVGVRIEHLQREIERALYGTAAGHPDLPKGEYQLSLRRGERAVYTFCMCPGGTVAAAASEEGGVVTNGMSTYRRDGENANAALVVSVNASDFGGDVFSGVHFQRQLERLAFLKGGGEYIAPCQTAGLFLQGRAGATFGTVRPTYPRGVAGSNFDEIFPRQICSMLREGLAAFDKRIAGYAAKDALMTGVETRTSSPLRILRGENRQAAGIQGLYPCGEGAGYAGGIMSAAVDGLKTAESIIGRYRPLSN